MGVSSKSPRHLIYGETGTYLLYVHTYASQMYKIFVTFNLYGRQKVPQKSIQYAIESSRTKLQYLGLQYSKCFIQVWFWCCLGNAGRWGCNIIYQRVFYQRLTDCFKQDWYSALESHDFCNVYSNFNHSLIRSPYLSLLNSISVRRVFA